MRNDPSRPHGPAWRQQPGAGRRNPKAQQGWRQEPAATPAATRVWSRKTKVWVGVATLGGLVAALVGVILWFLPPRPPTLYLFANGYQTNLAIPPNYYDVKLLGDLEQWARSSPTHLLGGRELPDPKGPPKSLAKGSDWFKDIDPNRFKEKTIVVFFALHGGADSKGAYLLLDDAEPRDGEEGLIRLSTVLDRLGELPKKKNKVLILDATQVPANWEFGMMHNDFAQKLKDLNSKIQAIDNCIVLSASDVDQRSWTSDVVQAPIFSYYLFQGLQGAGDPNRTHGINALELFQYVQKKVSEWARANRAAEQTPVLLPEGPEGEQRAKQIPMTQVPRPYGTPPDLKEPPLDGATDLDNQWNEFARLQRQLPTPAAYHPQLWQHYQALMLRYEDLLRAGDQASANRIKTELGRVADQLRENPLRGLPCVDNAIPLRAAFGLTLTTEQRTELDGKLDELWESQGAKWVDLRKWAREKLPGGEARLRLAACDRLLEKLTHTNDPATRTQVGAVLQIIAPDAGLRPAEAHYLYMALKHIPENQTAEYLQTALQTRRLAEQAALAIAPDQKPASDTYSYSARVYDWIKVRLKDADQKRRWGEDMLFASDPERWKRASELLNSALEVYKQVIDDAHVVALALNTRDQALACLPAYSRWLAERRVFAANRDAINHAMEELESLWGKAQRLSERLDNPDPNGIRKPIQTEADKSRHQDARGLEQLTDDVRKGMDDFHQARLNAVVEQPPTEVQPRWHEIEALLRVPLIDPDRRKELLAESRRISFRQYSEFMRSPQTGQVEPPHPLEAAQNQARMALAALGRSWVDRQAGDSKPTYLDLQKQIRHPNEKNWYADLLDAGKQIGLCWNQIPEEINRQSQSAHQSGAKVADVIAHLSQAEQLCRRIDGAAAPWVNGSPAEESVRLRLSGWLVALAGRTVDDQWFSEKGQAFYQIAADRFRESAQALLKGWDPQASKPLFAELDRLKETIRATPGLEIIPDSHNPEYVTSEKQVDFTFTLGGEGLRPGYPVLDMESPADQSFLSPTGTVQPAQWITQSVDANEKIAPLVYSFERNVKALANQQKVVKVDVTMKAFYRGQEKVNKSTIPCYPHPDTVVTQNPKPTYGKVAVRTDSSFGSQSGVISIVLDCSSSMWYPVEQEMVDLYNRERNNGRNVKQSLEAVRAFAKKVSMGRRKRKFDKATQGLEEVLQTLDNGFTVNLWVFGTADQKDNEVDKIWSTQSWNRNTDPQKIRDKISAIIPFGLTPLARALYKVKESDFKEKKAGFKTIVVLTDGMDTLFKKDPDLNPRGTLSIPKFLKDEFQDSGIQIFMALFEVPRDEIAEAKQQFGVLGDVTWKLPGKLYESTKEKGVLVENLMEALHPQLRYRLYGRNNDPVSREGYPVTSKKKENLQWSGPLQRTYKAEVHGFLDQDILINAGDFLIMNLLWKDTTPFLQRALYAEEYARFRDFPLETRKQNKSQLAVLQNYPNDVANTLQLKVALENLESRDSPRLLRQVWPRFVWFEVQAAGGGKPRCQWSNLEGYPAPLWSLDLFDWPGLKTKPANPLLSAWWTYDEDLAPLAKLSRRNLNVSLAEDFQEAAKKASRYQLQLHSPTFEDRDIDGQMKSCLVVRIRYPKGEPVLALPKFKHLDGARHCFYEEAQQYTGIFWTVSAGDIKEGFSMDIISLKDFKDKAKGQGNVISAWDVKDPNKSYQWNSTIGKAPDEAGSP